MSNLAHEGGSYSGLPNLQVSATNGINHCLTSGTAARIRSAVPRTLS